MRRIICPWKLVDHDGLRGAGQSAGLPWFGSYTTDEPGYDGVNVLLAVDDNDDSHDAAVLALVAAHVPKTNTRANLRQRLRMLLDRDEDVVIALLRAAVREQYLLTRELGAVVVALRQRVLAGSGNVPAVENVTFSDLVGKIKDRLTSDLAD